MKEVVIRKEEEGEEGEVARLQCAARGEEAPEEWHGGVEPEEWPRDLDRFGDVLHRPIVGEAATLSRYVE